ncbi:MAG: 3'-5' exonuclease [Bacteroidota bacterium]
MKLNLERPIAFFDLETTGTNIVSDRIVEIAIVKIQPDQSKETYSKRVNPEMLIPEASSAIHGITNKDVALSPTFEQLAPEIFEFLKGCDLGGFNSNRFDIPLLVEEFLRYGFDLEVENRKLVDVQAIFHRMEERTLSAAYRFYCDKNLENAHSAEADAVATYEILEAQLDRYGDKIQSSVEFLHEFSKRNSRTLDIAGRFALNDKDVPCFNFGKHKGKPVKEVFELEPGYYGWMLQAEFALDTKNVLKKIKIQIDTK